VTVFLFFLILTVVAGLVAAGGDRMGHLAARRKIRFGKMRPRHVSTLIAVVSGIVISLVTSLVLFLVVSDVREALTKYDGVKSDLQSAQAELSVAKRDTRQAVDDMNDAVSARDEAVAGREQAEADLENLEGELSNTRGLLSEAVIQLDTAQEDVKSAQAEVRTLASRKAELEADIRSYEDTVEPQLREMFTQVRAKLQQWEHGTLAIPKGMTFTYEVLAAGEGDQVATRIENSIMRINSVLAEENISFSKDRSHVISEFVADYPYRDSDHGVVIVFSAATNALEGGEIGLAINAIPLTPIVVKNDEVMTVKVEGTTAFVSWMGEPVMDFTVPARFDAASLDEFTTDLWLVFNAGAEGMGFLPDLKTGEIATPVTRLTAVYDDIIGRQRPFIIQFVAKNPATALDGLSDCNLYISKWPPEN